MWHAPPRLPASFHTLCEMAGIPTNPVLGCELRAQARADAHGIMWDAVRSRDAVDEENGHAIAVPAVV